MKCSSVATEREWSLLTTTTGENLRFPTYTTQSPGTAERPIFTKTQVGKKHISFTLALSFVLSENVDLCIRGGTTVVLLYPCKQRACSRTPTKDAL